MLHEARLHARWHTDLWRVTPLLSGATETRSAGWSGRRRRTGCASHSCWPGRGWRSPCTRRTRWPTASSCAAWRQTCRSCRCCAAGAATTTTTASSSTTEPASTSPRSRWWRRVSLPAAGEIEVIVHSLASPGLHLHGFGVKAGGLVRYADCLVSAGSLAWSFEARRAAPMASCRHANCANCLRYAAEWRERTLARLGAVQVHQRIAGERVAAGSQRSGIRMFE
jgi:hypothetical protein